MRVSAKADYAVRAMVELAAPGDLGGGSRRRARRSRVAQAIPLRFLENILGELRVARAGAEQARQPTAATGSRRDADDDHARRDHPRGRGAAGDRARRGRRRARVPRRARRPLRAGLARAAGEHPPGARVGDPRRRRRRASCRSRSARSPSTRRRRSTRRRTRGPHTRRRPGASARGSAPLRSSRLARPRRRAGGRSRRARSPSQPMSTANITQATSSARLIAAHASASSSVRGGRRSRRTPAPGSGCT